MADRKDVTRRLIASRDPMPQSPACDRCSVGVMDATNPHLWGKCKCACHRPCDYCGNLTTEPVPPAEGMGRIYCSPECRIADLVEDARLEGQLEGRGY